MLQFVASGDPLVSSGNITAFTSNGVIYGAIRTGSDVTTQQYLKQASQWFVFIISGTLRFQKAGATAGVWSVPISASTNYQYAILFNHNASTTAPTIYLNGVSQTVTTVTAPVTPTADAAGLLYVGGLLFGSYVFPFLGSMCDIAGYQGSLTAIQLARLTTSRLHGYILQFGANVLWNFWMNEIPDGVAAATSNTILPDGDLVNTWYLGTSTYTNINVWNDGLYAHANASDDNEPFDYSFGTFTIPAGETVVAFKVTGESPYAESQPLALKYKLGGDASFTTAFSMTAASTFYSLFVYQSLTQAQIDGMTGELLTGTLASGEDCYADYCDIKVYSMKYTLRDRRPTGLVLNATAGPVGLASNWMTYA